MTDIVERLRKNMELDAVKEIERLRSDIERHVSIAAEQATEIERLRSLSEWRPIESAPKDGTPVLLLAGVTKNVGWWAVDKWSYGGGRWGNDVTHWLPLPPAPSKEG